MNTTYSTHALMEYLPTRYTATPQQQADRNEVYRFKDGNCSSRVLDGLVSEINRITGTNKERYLICFIPASTAAKTRTRFQELAANLRNRTGCEASLTGIHNAYDRESAIVTGKTSNPTASFCVNPEEVSGKKIILIDDVITRGRSFNGCAAKLMAAGATSVEGLFVAKTINPDYISHGCGYDFDPDGFYEDEFDPMDFDGYYEPDPEDFYDEPDPEDYYGF